MEIVERVPRNVIPETGRQRPFFARKLGRKRRNSTRTSCRRRNVTTNCSQTSVKINVRETMATRVYASSGRSRAQSVRFFPRHGNNVVIKEIYIYIYICMYYMYESIRDGAASVRSVVPAAVQARTRNSIDSTTDSARFLYDIITPVYCRSSCVGRRVDCRDHIQKTFWVLIFLYRRVQFKISFLKKISNFPTVFSPRLKYNQRPNIKRDKLRDC